jgi:hypothetical protein
MLIMTRGGTFLTISSVSGLFCRVCGDTPPQMEREILSTLILKSESKEFEMEILPVTVSLMQK